MATLVSPGVSVTVINESFYIPASAPTVPLIFIATQANKLQPDNVSPATGTEENSVIRTVTSIGQSVQLYGIPFFLTDNSGNAYNGSALNEYGLFALNEFLSIGNLAYVIRANVDLANEPVTFIGIGAPITSGTSFTGVGSGSININSITTLGVVVPGSLYTNGVYTNVPLTGGSGTGATANITVAGNVVTLVTLVLSGMNYAPGDVLSATPLTGVFSTTGNGTGFMIPVTAVSGQLTSVSAFVQPQTIDIIMNSPTTFTVIGSVSGIIGLGVVGVPFTSTVINFTITAGLTPFSPDDYFQFYLVYTFTSYSGVGNGIMNSISPGPNAVPET